MDKVAYLILAHQDPAQLSRLIRALDHRADFFVHIDAKVDLRPFIEGAAGSSVRFLEGRVAVTWAGFSMVGAILALIQGALASGSGYSHLVLLSGADYPIKPASVIVDHLARNRSHEFIRFIDMRNSPDHYMRQIEQRHFRDPILAGNGRIVRLFDKCARRIGNMAELSNRWDRDYIPYFGSTWWAMTPECCLHILSTIEGDGGRFLEMNRLTFSPDEHFFHTIVGNSEFCGRSDGLQDYLGVGTVNLANLHLIDPSLSKWFTIEDRAEVAGSDRFFVRKVRTDVSTELLDYIDAELLRA
jgi:hypothetical protein